MIPTEIVLSAKLKAAEPTLDVLGADRKVLQVATEDLTYYMRFLLKNSQNVTALSPGQDEHVPIESSPEVGEFLSVWTSIWLKKWKQRFRLMIGQCCQQATTNKTQNSQNNEKLMDAWYNLVSKEELIETIALALIKNSEICGTRIIAESILKQELQKTDCQDVNKKQKVLALLNNALHAARYAAQKTGPLVSIKVEKDYYLEVTN